MANRVTAAIASAYDRSRVHVGSVRRGETRPVSVDFASLLDTAETIDSVVWKCNAPWVGSMSSAAISGSTTSVQVAFQQGGMVSFRATAETSLGNSYTQTFQFAVHEFPSFDDSAVTAGPSSLTVSV